MVKIISLCILFLLLLAQPVWGVTTTQPERTVLTLELLQERLRSPTKREGIPTLDLQQMVIDLRPENAEFRDSFYQLLRTQLQRAGSNPLGLDLSYSLIQGDLAGTDLGLRTPLYGQSLTPIFTPTQQEQLQRERRLAQLKGVSSSLNSGLAASSQIIVFRGPLKLVQTRFTGSVNFTNTFFLQPMEAQGAIFTQDADWTGTRFSRDASLAGATFRRAASFRSSIFFAKAEFNQAQFQESAFFTDSLFENTANSIQASFKQMANFSRVQWLGNADFSQVRYSDRALFTKDQFNQSFSLTEATFEQAVAFREAQFNQSVNLLGTSIQGLADFSDVEFAKGAVLNVSGLTFDSDQAKILGNPDQIGRVMTVPRLQGNENVLRNLVQNFRQMQQIADANQLEYITQMLRRGELCRRLLGTNINTASPELLLQVGFSAAQAAAIAQHRDQQPFHNLSELMTLEEINLATYMQVRDLIVAGTLSPSEWLLEGLQWLGLSMLLLLSRYGTSFWLVFGVGIVAFAYFGMLFWLIDRWRRVRPQRIIPTLQETIWVLSSFSLLTLFGLTAIFHTAEQPWITLGSLAIVVLPVPAILLWRLYQKGRYHDLMDISYFVEDGSTRQLRLLIGRLPVMPRFPLFRERYLPLLWNRRWNWLNYYDFSLNNLLKLGFNDIRLRDEHLPSIVSSLAWYQWSLGLLYITLLLWTLSRTIPGLNLLFYLK